MARKKRKWKRKHPRPRPVFPARFSVGTQVRVKSGTTDPDFLDIPLGGWAGTIAEVNPRSNPPLYLIEWNQHTLAHMHPVFRSRCERDGLFSQEMWLDEEDLEPDSGEPAVMEQPTTIVTRPLDPKDQDDRIRAILEVTSNDPLPEADEANLDKYQDHLARHLSFPFQAKYNVETGPLQLTEYPVTILGLLDDYEEEEGLLCKADQQGQSVELPLADLILKGHGRNRQLVEDYGYWFCNYWGSDEGDYDSSSEVIYSDSQGSLAGRGSFFGLLLKFGFEGAMAGVVLGMTLTTVPWAPIGAGVGLVLGSLILGVTGGKEGRTGGMVHGSVIGSVFGAVIGGAWDLPWEPFCPPLSCPGKELCWAAWSGSGSDGC